jgi:phosphoribosylglycinamide formyltransferase-1
MAKLKAGVLISGRGSNLLALLQACAAPGFPAEITLVASNRAEAAGLANAHHFGVPTKVVPHGNYPDRESFDRAVSAALEAAGVELVCLAGFMRIFSPWFPARWRHRVINVHPSLLPSFRGLNVHQQAIDSGARLSGATVHFVTEDLDAGPIIVQGAVPLRQDDTVETLSARILKTEHELYPLALRWFGERRVRIEATPGKPDRVVIDGVPADATILWRP